MRFQAKLLTAARPTKKKPQTQLQALVPILEKQKQENLKKAMALLGYKGRFIQEDFMILKGHEVDEEWLEEMRLEDPEFEQEPEGSWTPQEEIVKIHNTALKLPGTFFIWAVVSVNDIDYDKIAFQVLSLPTKPEGLWPDDGDREGFNAQDGDGSIGCGTKQDMMDELTYIIGEAGNEDADPMQLEDEALIERQKLKRKR